MTTTQTYAGMVLNVGLDPRVLDDAPSTAFPAVDAARVRAGLEAAAASVAEMGLGFDTCLVERGDGAEEQLRTALTGKHYDIIMVGGGVRLDPAMTPLFEKLVNVARVHAPDAALCFNTGPETTPEAVRRWWPTA